MSTKKPPSDIDEESLALGQRLNELAELVGGKKEMARLGGISEVQIYRYINGENIPSIRAISRLARAADVSINWLVNGIGPRDNAELEVSAPEPSIALDRGLLAHIIEAVHRSDVLGAVPAEKLAKTISDVYAEVATTEHDKVARLRMADAILITVSRLIR